MSAIILSDTLHLHPLEIKAKDFEADCASPNARTTDHPTGLLIHTNRSVSALAMEASLTHLPDEILHSILYYSSPRAAAALECTARRFRNIAKEPLLWRHYCRSHFRFWEHRHDFENKLAGPVSSVDWKGLYVSRHLTDSTVTDALEDILSSQRGRLEKFRAIMSFGYDAKDTLIRNTLVGSDREDHLARRLALHST